MVKEKQTRIYKINKPSFLSCDKVYITDTNNKIIVWDKGYGSLSARFVFRQNREAPYTLAPYPLEEDYKWGSQIKKGTKVYPSCDVDAGCWDKLEDNEIVRIQGIQIVQSLKELRNFLDEYKTLVHRYSVKLNQDLKKIDNALGKEKKELERKIKEEKNKIRKQHNQPNIADLFFN